MNMQVDDVNDDQVDNIEDLQDELDSSDDLEGTIAQADDVPAKFKGKSLKDVISSYENLEKEFGRKANEVGELRKLTDQLLDLQATKKPEVARKTVSTDDLLENPDETLNSVIAEHPLIKDMNAKLLEQSIKESKAAFEAKHPDWQTKMSSPEFAQFVQSTPTLLKMFQEAHKNYDYGTGSYLLEMFEAQVETKTAADKATRDAGTKKAMKDAAVETGTKREAKKKVFTRAYLAKLMIDDPRKYAELQPEIHLAYKEGRVK